MKRDRNFFYFNKTILLVKLEKVKAYSALKNIFLCCLLTLKRNNIKAFFKYCTNKSIIKKNYLPIELF